MLRVLSEALIVGVLLIFFANISIIILKLFNVINKNDNKDSDKDSDNWNKNYIMEKSLLLTGFIFHITFELLGINKFYCLYGYVSTY